MKGGDRAPPPGTDSPGFVASVEHTVNRAKEKKNQLDREDDERVREWHDEAEIYNGIYEARRRDRDVKDKRYDPMRREKTPDRSDKRGDSDSRINPLPTPPMPQLVPSFMPGTPIVDSRVHPDRVTNITDTSPAPKTTLKRQTVDEVQEGWLPDDPMDMDTIPQADDANDEGTEVQGGLMPGHAKVVRKNSKGKERERSKSPAKGDEDKSRKWNRRTTTRIVDEVKSTSKPWDGLRSDVEFGTGETIYEVAPGIWVPEYLVEDAKAELAENARKREEEKRLKSRQEAYEKMKKQINESMSGNEGSSKASYRQKKTALQQCADDEGIDLERDKYRHFPARIKGMIEENPFDPVKFLLNTKLGEITVGEYLEWSPLAQRLFMKSEAVQVKSLQDFTWTASGALLASGTVTAPHDFAIYSQVKHLDFL